jgi:hypothetical protein
MRIPGNSSQQDYGILIFCILGGARGDIVLFSNFGRRNCSQCDRWGARIDAELPKRYWTYEVDLEKG